MKQSQPWEKSPRPIREPGPAYRWRKGYIYSRNHPSRCSSSWGRTWLEEWRQRDQVAIPVTASDAAIFGAQVAGDVCIFARVDVDAGISWTHAERLTRVSFYARM